MNTLAGVVGEINNILYSYLIIILLLAVGIILTIRTRLVQVRYFFESIRLVGETQAGQSVSSFRALMISTASRVGTGNIAGVTTAVGLGGPGAVFWMWVTAVIGGASAFVESTLAQIYKQRDGSGHFRGGPAYYIQTALGSRKFGVVFAVCLILCFAYGFNPLQAYNMGDALRHYVPDYANSSAPMLLGVALAVFAGLVIFGGVTRIGWANSRLVPLMAGIYILLAVIVFFRNIDLLPSTIRLILAGSCVMQGVKRGLYSNEAGMGSAPNAAAAADVTHPVKQGLVQMLAVFLDTMVICSATAVLILMSGLRYDGPGGMPHMQAAVQSQFGDWGIHFITVSVFLFAFTSLLGNYYYTESNLLFIKNDRKLLRWFRWTAVLAIFIGPQYGLGLAWDMADLLMGVMTLVHLGPLLLLSGIAVKALNDYAAKRRAGQKSPEFKASDIGLGNTELWK